MDHPQLNEDPVILEIQEIRAKLREQTRGMSPQELSRWYREQAALVEECYYGKSENDKSGANEA